MEATPGAAARPGHLMASEMAEQPAVLAAIGAGRGQVVADLARVLPDRPLGIVLVARGSSDHAAVYGRYLLELCTGLPVALAAPSLHTLYGARVRYGGFVAVAISQSGRTPEIVDVLERLAHAGATPVAVTNDPGSPLAAVGAALVPLGAGLERAVPATKTVTAQMAVFAVIAEALGAAPWDAEVWRRLPDGVGRVLADDEPAQVAAAAIGSAAGLIAVGRGLLFGAALEAALKLKETTGLHAEGYSAADLRHGPLAVIDAGFPVLALSARGPAAADMADLTRRLAAERGARVLRVADDAAADLALPQDLPEAPSAITAVVRAQQLALALALRRDLDPDTPPGLTKVTPTT